MGSSAVGFKLDFGEDGTGWQFKYLTRGGGVADLGFPQELEHVTRPASGPSSPAVLLVAQSVLPRSAARPSAC